MAGRLPVVVQPLREQPHGADAGREGVLEEARRLLGGEELVARSAEDACDEAPEVGRAWHLALIGQRRRCGPRTDELARAVLGLPLLCSYEHADQVISVRRVHVRHI